MYIADKAEQPVGNIGDITKLFLKTNDDKINMKLLKKDMKNKGFIDKFDQNKQLKTLKSIKVIPKEIIDNNEVKNAIKQFRLSVLNEIKKYNDSLVEKDFIFDSLYDNYFIYKSGLSEKNMKKSLTEKLIYRDLNNLTDVYLDKINIVTALNKLELDNIFFFKKVSFDDSIDGFTFTKELRIEKPIDFFIRVFKKYVRFNKKPENEITRENIEELFNIYCFDLDDYLVESKTNKDMDEELRSIKLISNLDNRIYYNGKDIESESPGTQTNILMEYIVKCDTSKII